jgi:hypothetical protein
MMMDLRREHTNCTQLMLHKPAADRIHIHNRRLPGSAIAQISARFDGLIDSSTPKKLRSYKKKWTDDDDTARSNRSHFSPKIKENKKLETKNLRGKPQILPAKICKKNFPQQQQRQTRE